MRNLIPGLFLALFLALGVSLFCGYQLRRELVRAGRLAEADHQTIADLADKLKAAENIRLAADASQADIRRIFPEGHPVPAPEMLDKFNAAVDSDPVWEPFYQKLERRRVLSRYDILLAALKIPPPELAPLEDVLVERAVTTRFVVHQQRNTGRKFNSPEVITAVARATDDADARIRKLVGADTAQKLKEWNSAIYSYGNAPDGPVAQDAVTLEEAGFHLDTDQLVNLALIHYEVYVLHSGVRLGPTGDRVDSKTGLTPLEEQLFRRQAEVLSADEIAVLRSWTIEAHKARAALDAIRTKFDIVVGPAGRAQ
jgi:hypothetical protein